MKKKVIITGSSGLIGTELSKEFISQGYLVTGLDKKGNRDFKHPSFDFIQCDLSDQEDMNKAAARIPKIDVLINNVARTDLTFKKFSDVTLKDWDEGIRLNLTSYFYMSQIFMERLRQSKGSIINIASTRHLQSEENTEIYSASKGGIISLTHAMAVTQKHFVRVNSISPGWIADPSEDLKEKDHEQHLAGRVGRPSDVAGLALYLASEAAAFVTGQDFIIDGGMTRKMIYI